MANYADYDGPTEGDDTPLINQGQQPPRPGRFAESATDNVACVLSLQDGRLGFDQADPPIGLENYARLLHDARNARSMPGDLDEPGDPAYFRGSDDDGY